MTTHAIDPKQLRKALGTFVTGVTVITTIDATGRRYGLTANSFSSVSLDPPLILWSLSNTAPSFPVFQTADRFVVNILAEDQVHVSGQFASRAVDKFAGIAMKSGIGGLPIIEGSAAYLQCRKVATHPGGDHAVFIGHVEAFHHTAHKPLVFGGGSYLMAEPHEFGPAQLDTPRDLVQLKAIRLATRAMAEMSRRLGHTFGVIVWGNRGPTVVRWEAPATPFTLHLPIGEVLPVLNSASGLAFAAYLPEAVTRELVDEAIANDAVADMPGATLAHVNEKLEAIRLDGAARISGKPRPDVSAVSGLSVPVFDDSGAMVCALTTMGSSATFDAELDASLAAELKACARVLSSQLGYQEDHASHEVAPANGSATGSASGRPVSVARAA